MRVELEGVGKTYDGERWAVRNLRLEVPSGSIFGLIGPNGAGKSTTLRMMATLMAPSEGRVLLDSIDAFADPLQARRKIGFLGDGNPLYKHMTPAEYLRLFGQCFRMPADALEPAIDETLATFDLLAKRDSECGSLSKGMRQRVLIARCLLHQPGLLILDEPGDGLDPSGRADLRRLLGKIRERGVTIVISSHILRELDDLCDEVAILQAGKLVVAGDVERILDQRERNVFELRTVDGHARALELLAAAEGVKVETESPPAPGDRWQGTIRLCFDGDERRMAELLAQLIQAGVRVLTCSRIRTRLEDIYDRVADDQVA